MAQTDPGWRRAALYILIPAGFLALYPLLSPFAWLSGREFHTEMELLSTLMAMLVGSFALVGYHSRKDPVMLFIGAGFIGTGFLDGYHAVVTSSVFAHLLPSDLGSLIPWSWTASRLFLSLMLAMSWLVWRSNDRKWFRWLTQTDTRLERVTYVSVAAMTLGVFYFFISVPLPRAYYDELVFHRPEEFLPAVFFAIALWGYWHKGAWRTNAFEHWIVIALALNLVAQIIYMPFSARLFDMQFDVAHLLKVVSYLCVLIGLLTGILEVYRRVAEQHQEIGAVLDGVFDSVITIDEKGAILSANVMAEEMFLYDQDEFTKMNVRQLMPDPYSLKHDSYLDAYLATGKKNVMDSAREVIGRRKDRSTFPMDLGVRAASVPGRKIFVGVCRDITIRKAAEEALKNREAELKKSNEELENFAYVASHDLKAPLRAIDSLAAWIAEDLDGKMDENTAENLRLMKARVRRMEGLLEGLLEYSRVGHASCEIEQIDSGKLLDTMIGFMDLPEGFTVEVSNDMPVVESEKPPLELVFRNLIRNAIKHHDRDNGRIEISGQTQAGLCEFVVRDDGPGIPEEFHERIFGMFQTLKPRDEVEGSGMGLALVRKAVEKNSGSIRVISAGRGTEFRFTWKSKPSAGEENER